MPIRKVESVRKRDGSVVPYDEQKIADAILNAARSSGQDNPTIGRDLASVVTMYLERYRERDLTTSEEIQQLVEKILFDTGHAPIARAFIVHREKKGQPAEVSAPPTEDLFPSNLLLVDGATRGEVTPWGRERISAALVKEAGIEETAAADSSTPASFTTAALIRSRPHGVTSPRVAPSTSRRFEGNRSSVGGADTSAGCPFFSRWTMKARAMGAWPVSKRIFSTSCWISSLVVRSRSR